MFASSRRRRAGGGSGQTKRGQAFVSSTSAPDNSQLRAQLAAQADNWSAMAEEDAAVAPVRVTLEISDDDADTNAAVETQPVFDDVVIDDDDDQAVFRVSSPTGARHVARTIYTYELSSSSSDDQNNNNDDDDDDDVVQLVAPSRALDGPAAVAARRADLESRFDAVIERMRYDLAALQSLHGDEAL